jgi:hypothetical protein
MKGLEVTKIIGLAEKNIMAACKIDGRDRTGGMLCVADKSGVILICQIGEIADLEKAAQWRITCQEKTKRLLSVEFDYSSWQTRDFDNKKYGGAVRTKDGFIISFSGLSEHLDEAFSALIAHRMALGMGMWPWADIKRISNNPHMAEAPGYIV